MNRQEFKAITLNLKKEKHRIADEIWELHDKTLALEDELEFIIDETNKACEEYKISRKPKKPFTKEIFEKVLNEVTKPISYKNKRKMIKKLVNGKVRYYYPKNK